MMKKFYLPYSGEHEPDQKTQCFMITAQEAVLRTADDIGHRPKANAGTKAGVLDNVIGDAVIGDAVLSDAGFNSTTASDATLPTLNRYDGAHG